MTSHVFDPLASDFSCPRPSRLRHVQLVDPVAVSRAGGSGGTSKASTSAGGSTASSGDRVLRPLRLHGGSTDSGGGTTGAAGRPRQ